MKKKKILITTILVTILLLLTGVVSYGKSISYELDEPIVKLATIEFNKSDMSGIYDTTGTTYDKVGGKVLGYASYLCYAAAIIVLLVKGVQFMNKAPEAKAESKKELVSYAIGAFILFGIGSIINIISNIAMNEWF